MEELLDPDMLSAVLVIVDLLIYNGFYWTIDITNSNSLIMSLWNLLPIVGSNPLPQATFLWLLAVVGSVIGYYRWFK